MKLGERLIKNDLAVEQQIKKALQIQRRTGGKLGDILLATTSIRALDYYKTLAQHFGMQFVDLLKKEIDITLLKDADHNIYLTKEVIPIKFEHHTFTVTTSSPSSDMIDFIKTHWGPATQITCTTQFDILTTLQRRFNNDYLSQAVKRLVESDPRLSAKTTFSTWQIIFLVFIAGMSLYLIFFNPLLFYIILNVFLAVSVSGILAYKLMLSIIALLLNVKYKKPDLNLLPKDNLPIYSILIPLFKEKEVTLKNLFDSLKMIEYPKHRLDIKILLEQDDYSTIEILKNMHLPKLYEFIYVPPGEPRTKAKACNYGLKFARGEYLTLYDAEDKPDPYQLKISLYTFLNHKDDKLACVQSRLNFYNSQDNWLTRMFTIEYTYWFDLLLPALEYMHTPIPLGGTSNHFKTSILNQIEAWDPYNVAEDADIGIRLERLGYTSTVIASTTYEEANCSVVNWLKQRTRWIKGYMQTYIVHMRQPYKLFRSLGVRGFIGFQLFLGGTILTNLSYLLLWVMFIIFIIKPPSGYYSHLPASTVDLQIFNFIAGSTGMILLNVIGSLRRKRYSFAFLSLTAPFYWLLMSLASYRALYQLFFNPSYWDKTEHGISKTLN